MPTDQASQIGLRPGSWLKATPIAHRGYHDGRRPENSLAAFTEAISRSLAIELDVLRSVDGAIVVFHDYTTTRLTGADLDVENSRLSQLKALRLAGSGEKIPLLGEVLDLVAGRVPLLIEIKPTAKPGKVCRGVLDSLQGYDGELAIQSFDPRVLMWFRRHSPQTLRVQLATRMRHLEAPPSRFVRFMLSTMAVNALTRPAAIGYDIRSAPSVALRYWRHALDCPVLFWTVKSGSDLNRAHRLNGNVIVDFKYFAAAEDLRVPA